MIRLPNKYRNPPVSEVYCEFRFVPTTEWDITFAGLFYREVEAEYPLRRKTFLPQVPGSPPEMAVNIGDSIQFHRLDGSGYIQIAPNLLSVNLNPPYPGWENYLPHVLETLGKYHAVAAPHGFQRIGLRYINQIVLPGNVHHLKDWFHYYPAVPEEAAPIGGFVMFSQSFCQNERDLLGVQLASGEVDVQGNSVCLLDLDYGLAMPGTVPLDQADTWLDQAHGTIEQRFEAFITSQLRQLFEPYE